MSKSHRLGTEGEEMAKDHLLSLGYTILENNWRYGKYEVDIIAQTGDTIVFVEVKARSTDLFVAPEMAVNARKQKFLLAAANAYILQKDIHLEARFDIVAVLSDNNSHTVKHLPGAFYPRAS